MTMKKLIENQANELDELPDGPKLSEEAKLQMKQKMQQNKNLNN
jgi:hypothetical protein